MYTIFHPPDSWSRKHSKKLQVQKVWRGFTTDIKPSANMFLTLRAAWGERRGREKKNKKHTPTHQAKCESTPDPCYWVHFSVKWSDCYSYEICQKLFSR